MPSFGYTPDEKGLRAIAQDAAVQAQCMEQAQRIASAANALDPDGIYVAEAAEVPAGWDDLPRAGATVTQTGDSPEAGLHHVLQRALYG